MSAEKPLPISKNDDGHFEHYETEQIGQVELQWLAGLMEAGGSIFIQRNEHGEKGYVTGVPVITIKSANQNIKEYLFQKYGGSTETSSQAIWKISGRRAAELVVMMKPYLQTRIEAALAMENFLQEETSEGKAEIAEELRAFDRLADASEETYMHAVLLDAFVAGVIDNKGSIYPHKEGKYTYPRLEVGSTNVFLVKALYSRFGGTLRKKKEAGSVANINDKLVQTKKDLWVWCVSNEQARNVLQLAIPYLKIQPYSGWEFRLVEQRMAERRQEAEQILQFVLHELELFDQGMATHISTNEDIANHFSLSKKTAMRRIALMPSYVKKRREAILRRKKTDAV